MGVKGLFIAGTGTGVGKTVATAALYRRLVEDGIPAVTMKPVETGVPAGVPLGPDLQTHDSALPALQTDREEDGLRAPCRYALAASPHLAAAAEGADFPDLATIRESMCQLAAAKNPPRWVLVEGAGGLYVPLSLEYTQLDLIQSLGIATLLVAPLGLGTINHTLLSIDALRARDIPIAGIVFSDTAPDTPALLAEDNPATIARISGESIAAILPHFATPTPEAWETWAGAWDTSWLRDTFGG